VDQPVLIYDGDCGFCKRWVLRFHAATHGAFTYTSFQESASDYPDINPADFAQAAQLIEDNGKKYSGARAMLGALAMGHGPSWPLQAYQHVPGLKLVVNLVYHFIASHRMTASKIDRFLWGAKPTSEPPTINTLQRVLASLTGLAFFIYGTTYLPRWSALEGWTLWAVIGCLVVGPLLTGAYLLKLRNIFRISGRILIILTAAAPLYDVIFFKIMYIPLKWNHWALFGTPVVLLTLFFLTPPVTHIFKLIGRAIRH